MSGPQNAALWPTDLAPLVTLLPDGQEGQIKEAFSRHLAEADLPATLVNALPRFYLPLAAWLWQQKKTDQTLRVGVNGAQGSGKSTLCELLSFLLERLYGCRSAILSIDDLYLPRADLVFHLSRAQRVEQITKKATPL